MRNICTSAIINDDFVFVLIRYINGNEIDLIPNVFLLIIRDKKKLIKLFQILRFNSSNDETSYKYRIHLLGCNLCKF